MLRKDISRKKTHYDILGVSQLATEQDISKAYKKLAVQHHPDKNPDNSEQATLKMKEINEAYEVLADPVKRNKYNETLFNEEKKK